MYFLSFRMPLQHYTYLLFIFSRTKSAVDTTSEFVDMYIEVPVEEWGKQLEAADIPNLR